MGYILSLSYGKDSLACIEAIKRLDLPLDHIIHAEIWATDTIPADLPPMVEFKKHADKKIKKRYGLEVEHISATKNGKKQTYERQFYTINKKKNRIYGFPFIIGAWCNSRLKKQTLNHVIKKCQDTQYLGIAADETKRIIRWENKQGYSLPLVKINWTEADCFQWCKENNLLSPIYQTSTRGGCWFCHNQSVAQLRELKKNFPDLWEILLQWDTDSPTTFKPDGHTVHDFEKRFVLEKKKDLFLSEVAFSGKCCRTKMCYVK